jgi:hypothetical protein
MHIPWKITEGRQSSLPFEVYAKVGDSLWGVILIVGGGVSYSKGVFYHVRVLTVVFLLNDLSQMNEMVNLIPTCINTLGVLHNPSNISENNRQNGCVIIEGTPHENKMAGKGQITSERGSS